MSKILKLNYIKADPAGNITIFILDPVEPALYISAAEQILADKSLSAEQVGYIIREPSGWRLCMAGHEFCGNASRSFAAWLALSGGGYALRGFAEPEKKFTVCVSGSEKPLAAHIVNGQTANRCQAEVEMPLPLRIVHGCDKRLAAYSIVVFSAITHLVLWDRLPAPKSDCSKNPDGAQLPAGSEADLLAAEELCRALNINSDCLGLLYYNQTEHSMRPLVSVKQLNSLMWESSCGSGSSAVAAAWAAREKLDYLELAISQPGGTLNVKVQRSSQNSSGRGDAYAGPISSISLGGEVSFSAPGQLAIKI